MSKTRCRRLLKGIRHVVRTASELIKGWAEAGDTLLTGMTQALEGLRRHCRNSYVLTGCPDNSEEAATYDEVAGGRSRGQSSLVDEGLRHPSPSSPREVGTIGMGHALAKRTGGCDVGSDLASEHRTPGHGGVDQSRDAAVKDRQDG